MKKIRWYIWFSIIAFAALEFDTERRLTCSKQNPENPRKSPFWGHSFGLFMLWCVPTIVLFEIVDGRNDVLTYLPLASAYFLGVLATHMHVLWREKNIPHLLKQDKTDGSVSN